MRLLLVVLIALPLAACSGGDEAKTTPSNGAASSSAAPAAFNFSVYGDVVVDIDASYHGANGATVGEKCVPDDGYDDLTAGTQVIVATDTGKTLALGALDAPVFVAGEGSTKIVDGHCRLDFIVTDVPGGHDFYSLEIGRRGGEQYTREQLKDRIHLVLR